MFGYNSVGGNISVVDESISGTSTWAAPSKGSVVVENGSLSYFFEIDDPSGANTYIDGNYIRMERHTAVDRALDVILALADAGAMLRMVSSSRALLWQVNADGSEQLSGSIGVNGQDPPGFPVLATGAGHTVDNVIAFLQLCGFCRQS